MLQAYIDDSGKGDPDLFVLAGYIASAEQWAAFSNEWQQRLDMSSSNHARIGSFKMSEFRHSPEHPERTSWFYKVIEDHAQAAIACVIDTKALIRVAKSLQWPSFVTNTEKATGNPFFLAFKVLVNMFAQIQPKMGINEPVDFIFDETKEKGKIISSWELYRQSVSDDVRKLTGSTPIFRSDNTTLPLQAADLLAYWVREWEVKGISDGLEKLKFDWAAKKLDMPRLLIKMGELEIRIEFNRWVDAAKSMVRVERIRPS